MSEGNEEDAAAILKELRDQLSRYGGLASQFDNNPFHIKKENVMKDVTPKQKENKDE